MSCGGLKYLKSFFVWIGIESVKETQRVTLDEIPMPELPVGSGAGDIGGVAPGYPDGPRGILKQKE